MKRRNFFFALFAPIAMLLMNKKICRACYKPIKFEGKGLQPHAYLSDHIYCQKCQRFVTVDAAMIDIWYCDCTGAAQPTGNRKNLHTQPSWINTERANNSSIGTYKAKS